MPSLTPTYLDQLTYSQQELATLRQLGEARGRQQLFARQRPEALEALRQSAIIESVVSSSRLEGVVAPANREAPLIRRELAPRDRSEQEIAGYRDALELIHQSWRDMPVTVNLILQLHATLYRYHPSEGGRFKATDNKIVERNQDGEVTRIRFEPVSAVETPQAMEDVVNGYRRALDQPIEPLIVIPLVILDFLCVHPFTDGNGRTGRLLTLLLLYRAGYEVGRYISLERVVEDAREAYYDALEASSAGWHEDQHDSRPWREFFWGVLLRAYREYEERVGAISGKGSKQDQVRHAVLKRTVPFQISELERECPGISRDTIRLVLRELRDERRIELLGRGRGAKWRVLEEPEPEPEEKEASKAQRRLPLDSD